MDQATQAWLDGLEKTGKLSVEQVAAFKAAAGVPEVDNFIKGSVLRQEDYSRQMATVTATQTTLAEAQAKLDQQRNELVDWRNMSQAQIDAHVARATKAEADVAAATTRLKALAVANGLDEATVLNGVIPEKKEAPLDTSNFITKDDIAAAQKKATAEEALIQATIHDLNARYRNLSGKDIENTRELVAGAIKSGKSIENYFSEQLKFGELQKAKDEAAVNARVAEEVEKQVATRLSAAQLNGSGIGMGVPDQARRSPVLREGGLNPETQGKLPELDNRPSAASTAVAHYYANLKK